MNESTILTVESREKMTKGQMNDLRKEGFVPASISQRGSEAISLSVRRDELARALAQNGATAIYRLRMGEQQVITAMVREIQSAPLTREWLHITFQQVSMTEETKADLPLVILGKDDVIHRGLEGMQQLDTLAVRGLPGDFPQAIEVDVSALEAGQQVTVADLVLPKGVTHEVDGDRTVYSVNYPRVQEEETPEATVAEDAATDEPAQENEKA